MNTQSENHMTVTSSLALLLADVHMLAMRARFYHWNVTGIWFKPLHELFEIHYDTLSSTEDLLAERLRALSTSAPYRVADLLSTTRLADDVELPDSQSMLRGMLSGFELVNASASALQRLAEQHEDAVTGDMMVALMTDWQKAIWMLRAHLS